MSRRVAVVGATGAVGREMLRILEEREFPADEVLAIATERSEGRRLPFRGREVVVRANGPGVLDGVDISLWSAGSGVSRELIPAAASAGTICIDNSSAFRMDPDVPLVVPEINAHALPGTRRIVAVPNCTAIAAIVPLAPLHREFGLREVVLSSYQSVSGMGARGIRELVEQVDKLHGQAESLGHPDRETLPVGDAFRKTIAYNAIPRVDEFMDDGFTFEEFKVAEESRKILETDAAFHVTCVRIPVMVGHGISLLARFERDVSPDAARELLRDAAGVRVVDDPSNGGFPTPLDAAGIDDVLVGRIRQPANEPRALMYFSAGDNLRKGAALNAVQIAELLVR